MSTELKPVTIFIPVDGQGEFDVYQYGLRVTVAEKVSAYCFTKEELERLLGETFDAGHSLGDGEAMFNYTDHLSKESLNMIDTKEQYIKSILP